MLFPGASRYILGFSVNPEIPPNASELPATPLGKARTKPFGVLKFLTKERCQEVSSKWEENPMR